MRNTTKIKIKQIIKNSVKDLAKILPIFFLAILISVIAEFNVPDKLIESILGKNLLVSVLVATLSGIILPFPQYASYPFASFLYNSGAYIGAVFAFIAGEVFIGNLFEDYLEIKYFSLRFWIMRFIVSFVLIIIAAIGVQYLV